MKHVTSSRNLAMRFVVPFSVLLGLLMAVGVNIGALVAPVFVIFVIAYAFQIIIGRRGIKDFLPVILWLMFGPVVVCCLVSGAAQALREIFDGLPGAVLPLLFVLLMVLSYLYVRWHRSKSSRDHQAQLQTNERQPLFPVTHDGSEDRTGSCAASESFKESSKEE